MSSYTQPRRGMRPDDLTNVMCLAFGCTSYVQEQYHARHVYMCQEHALQVWATVQEMIDPATLRDIAYDRVAPDEEKNPELYEPIPISESAGVVYFIRVGDLIKVGFSSDLSRRMKAYPPDAEVLAYYSGSFAEEQQTHQLLSAHRAKRREWYHPTPEVMAAVEDAKARQAQEPQPTPEQVAHNKTMRDVFSKRWHDIPPVIP